MKQYALTVGRSKPHCEFCRRRLVIRWENSRQHVWACLWHTRRAWKALEEEKA